MKALSICYITLNAERHLAASLQQSQRLTDDIIVVDSGSSDNTLPIAQAAHVTLIKQTWLGFSAQKQFAIDQAKHDWVLLLDADEILSDEAITSIRNALSNDENYTAYSLPRQNWFQGKWIKYGSWWPDRVVRLFDRTQGSMKPVPVHECWETNGSTAELASPIKHYSFNSYGDLLVKADRYSDIAAKRMFDEGKHCSKWSPLTHAFASFIRLFIIKRGYKDGIEGAAIAYTNGLGAFLKYAKLQALHRQSKENA